MQIPLLASVHKCLWLHVRWISDSYIKSEMNKIRKIVTKQRHNTSDIDNFFALQLGMAMCSILADIPTSDVRYFPWTCKQLPDRHSVQTNPAVYTGHSAILDLFMKENWRSHDIKWQPGEIFPPHLKAVFVVLYGTVLHSAVPINHVT